MEKGECVGALLGEGQDEDRLASSQQKGCLGEEGGWEPVQVLGPKGWPWQRSDGKGKIKRLG